MATTIQDIKTAIASYFEVAVADLTVNGQDLALLALNQVRRQAELNHDFEFQRKLVTVSVNGTTGGSLDAAVLYSDGTTAIDVKSVIEVGVFDTDGNLRPVEWTTVSESLERQRKEERFGVTDSLTLNNDLHQKTLIKRYALSGSQIFSFPKNTDPAVMLGLEVYRFSPDWTAPATVNVDIGGDNNWGVAYGTYVQSGSYNGKTLWLKLPSPGAYDGGKVPMAIWWISGTTWRITPCDSLYLTDGGGFTRGIIDGTEDFPVGTGIGYGVAAGDTYTVTLNDTYLASLSDTWTTYATQYLQWGAIVQLNHLFKHFVFRQEGNLPPPEKLRDEGLEAFKAWDAGRYENNRRHDR